MGRPAVSVLIDTYNHRSFIEQAIASVLGQDFPPGEREVVVVDDGSTDGTPEIIRKFEPQVRLLRKANGGQASAFNAGIPECRGEVIAFLDGDDWWAAGKLKMVCQVLQDQPEVSLIGHGIIEMHADGREHVHVLHEDSRFRADSESGARTFRLRKSFLGTSRMTYRASLLQRIGKIPEALRIEADEYLFTLGAALADVLVLREPLTFYRLHGANAFQISNGNVESIRRKQKVLEALAISLQEELPHCQIGPEVVRIIVETVQTEADVIRLMTENGMPWETVGVELRNYDIMNEHVSLLYKVLKYLSRAPACL